MPRSLAISMRLLVGEVVECIVPLCLCTFDLMVYASGNKGNFAMYDTMTDQDIFTGMLWKLANLVLNILTVVSAGAIASRTGIHPMWLFQFALQWRSFRVGFIFGILSAVLMVLLSFSNHLGAVLILPSVAEADLFTHSGTSFNVSA
jgi:hypothetical protein